MIEHELRRDQGILIVRPKGPLAATDFTKVARDIDPHIESEGKLVGLLVEAPSFPGWNDFAGLIAHFKFVRDHHRKIERVAVVTDDAMLHIVPGIAEHFAHPTIRVFGASETARALNWLHSTSHT
jgi:hypothetical protein